MDARCDLSAVGKRCSISPNSELLFCKSVARKPRSNFFPCAVGDFEHSRGGESVRTGLVANRFVEAESQLVRPANGRFCTCAGDLVGRAKSTSVFAVGDSRDIDSGGAGSIFST